MKEGFNCCICGKHTLGWGSQKQYGNNPYPLAKEGQCCNDCNRKVVVARIEEYSKRKSGGIKN